MRQALLVSRDLFCARSSLRPNRPALPFGGNAMIAIRVEAPSLYQIPNNHGYQQNRSNPEQMLF
jgi:hypothetical protein